jgi:hypothetical protein
MVAVKARIEWGCREPYNPPLLVNLGRLIFTTAGFAGRNRSETPIRENFLPGKSSEREWFRCGYSRPPEYSTYPVESIALCCPCALNRAA